MSAVRTNPNIVQYDLMFGREATEAIRTFPVGYLPIGCLERYGDYLPMGLDPIKVHSPDKATSENGEAFANLVIDYLKQEI